MSKIKLIDLKISADEFNVISNHYSRMGFEIIDCQHYSGTRYQGSVCNDGSFVGEHSNYDYYLCTYKFDMSQKNAGALWEIYKKYKKENKVLERLCFDKYGHFYMK